jgi:hypothetical protein
MKKRMPAHNFQKKEGLTLFEWFFVIGLLGLGVSLLVFAFLVSSLL